MAGGRRAIRKEASWMLSNVCAGSVGQIQEVIDANLAPLLVAFMVRGGPEVAKEACWALSNATTGGTSDQIAMLVHYGIIPPLKDMLTRPDARVCVVAMKGLGNILRHRPPEFCGAASYAPFLEKAGVPEALSALLTGERTPEAVRAEAEVLQKALASVSAGQAPDAASACSSSSSSSSSAFECLTSPSEALRSPLALPVQQQACSASQAGSGGSGSAAASALSQLPEAADLRVGAAGAAGSGKRSGCAEQEAAGAGAATGAAPSAAASRVALIAAAAQVAQRNRERFAAICSSGGVPVQET
jgi:hypothetical protein